MSIFRDFAPKYWAANIPAMPLKVGSKAPILNEWTNYGKIMPTKAVQEHWLDAYPRSNIGLPFGPASGLCAIDIDTEDQDLVDAIMDCLPVSPWHRKGKKGMGLIFKWSGQKNFKVRSNEGMICEFLGLGNQMVLPPSIHPDTGEPYTANADLWDVMDKVQPLPMDIEERLRAALGVQGFSLSNEGRSAPNVVVPQGERDIQLVRHAGYLARVVLGIDKKHKWSLAEAMTHMYTWVEDYTASASGDDMDPNKGVSKLLEFLLKDIESGRTLPEGWDNGLTSEQREHPTIAAMLEKNETQRWTLTKARAWLSENVGLKPGDDDWALERSLEIIQKVASDENFSDFHFAALMTEIDRALGDVKMSKPAMKAAFKQARMGDGDPDADHEAIAQRMIDDISRFGELRWAQGSFWQWNGSCFGQLTDNQVYRDIARSVKGNVLSKRHSDYSALVKTVSVLAETNLVQSLETGINFANGFLDSQGVLHEHSPKFGKTFTMPFNYVPARATEAHKWFEFLETVWGDDPDYSAKVLALQEAFAATMFGIAPEYQRAILLFGKAGSGKSQILEVLREMMPPAAVSAVPPHIWKERFALSDMVGKTLNVCGELPEDTMIQGDVFKGIVEGSVQRSEYKGKDAFQFTPIAAHWFASNFLPRSADSSKGFTRRWLILDFNWPVPASERIPDFYKVLVAEEREAIAAWAVQGFKRLVEQRDYTLPDSHQRRIEAVVRSNNSVAAWLEQSEKVRPTGDKKDTADARTCFDMYVWYMKDVSRGFNVTYERFKQMIGDYGYEVADYTDPLGVIRQKILGVKVMTPQIDEKWTR
jgi:P4 family phage/plasmid primase-like protien